MTDKAAVRSEHLAACRASGTLQKLKSLTTADKMTLWLPLSIVYLATRGTSIRVQVRIFRGLCKAALGKHYWVSDQS